MKRTLLTAILLSTLSCGALAATTHVSSQDKAWLKAAHQVDLEEIQAGAMAHRQGHSGNVQATGKTLASDHRRLDSKLVPLARQLDVSLPTSPNAKQRNTLQELRGEHGKAFDKAFLRDEIKGHKQAIAKTRKEISDGAAVEVKSLARHALPQLQKHLRMLKHDSTTLHHG